MAEPKRKRAAPVATPPLVPVLYIRGPTPETIAALDAWVAERRAELASSASDTASRRTAASFSRNDLVLDIIAAALKARAERGNAP